LVVAAPPNAFATGGDDDTPNDASNEPNTSPAAGADTGTDADAYADMDGDAVGARERSLLLEAVVASGPKGEPNKSSSWLSLVAKPQSSFVLAVLWTGAITEEEGEGAGEYVKVLRGLLMNVS
jgi:hypothetical protein